MATSREIERKYEVDDRFRLPELAGVGPIISVTPPTEHDLDATYYDTPQLDLIRHKVTLRRRSGGTDAGWHLKRPAGDGDRTETHAPLDDNDQPPVELTSQVRELVGDEPLAPVARIRTRRVEREVRNADGTVLAAVADDTVTGQVPGGGRGQPAVVQRWREVEVELVDGPRNVLATVDAALLAAGARPASVRSKLARTLGDRLPDRPSGIPAAPAPDGDRGTALTRYLRAQHEAIVGNEARVREADADAVHDMRVASRRLRSTLRTFRAVLDPARTVGLNEELKWLADALGRVRDGDVLAERLTKAVTLLPPELVVGPVTARITQRLSAQTAEAREDLVAALDSDRYARLLRSIGELVDHGEVPGVGRRRLRRLARKAVRRGDRRLAAADDAPVTTSWREPNPGAADRDERLHDARKAYKRARYAVEVLRAHDDRRAKRLAKRLSALQDVLGAHQDAIVANKTLGTLGMLAYEAGENGFTYGVLYGEQERDGARSLGELPAARRAASRRKVRRWLDR